MAKDNVGDEDKQEKITNEDILLARLYDLLVEIKNKNISEVELDNGGMMIIIELKDVVYDKEYGFAKVKK